MSLWIARLTSVPGVSSPDCLVDTSALSRIGHHESVRKVLDPLLTEGRLACCSLTWLEMGLTARDANEHDSLGAALTALPRVEITEADFTRAWEVQGLLASRGHHRGIALPDLILASCAERLGMTVIHCDGDFDDISKVTGQQTRWAVDRHLL